MLLELISVTYQITNMLLACFSTVLVYFKVCFNMLLVYFSMLLACY